MEHQLNPESPRNKLKRAAMIEANSTWVSPVRLAVLFMLFLAVTIYFNGL